jgi:hypothetical protein
MLCGNRRTIPSVREPMNHTHRHLPITVLIAALAAGGLAACADDGPESAATTVVETSSPDAAPDSTAPGSTAPGSTAPDTTALDTTAPETTTPGTSPESTEPESTTAGTSPESTELESTTAGDCAPEPTVETAAELVVGLTEEDAEVALDECGWIMRVGRRDGEDLVMTMDLRPNRVNVEVTDGEVTDVLSIG